MSLRKKKKIKAFHYFIILYTYCVYSVDENKAGTWASLRSRNPPCASPETPFVLRFESHLALKPTR